jgi:hypothetical protein
MSSDLISPGLSRLGQVFRVYHNNISAMSCTTTLILGGKPIIYKNSNFNPLPWVDVWKL